MRSALHAFLAIVFIGSLAPTFAGQTTDGGQIAGWYDVAPDHKLLIVWGPTGGYRLLDFDAARFHQLESKARDAYRVVGSGAWENATVAVDRARDGRATAVKLTPSGAEALRLPKAKESPFDVEEVRFRSGETELAGLLMIPRVQKLVGKTGKKLEEVPLPLPGAVFIHGSGESDRDNVWAFTIAQHVARAGFVTLLPDKRGSGASGGDWHTAGLDVLGNDALAAVAVLRGDRRVDPARIGLVGLSQGGVVAPLAAARSSDVDYVVSISAGSVTLFEQMRHEMRQDLTRAGLPAEGIDVVVAVGERALAYARTQEDASWSAYTAALTELKAGPFSAAAAGFPAARDDWHWSWWRQVGDVDPVPAWRGLDRPALAVFGEDDERDNVPVQESVRRLQAALRPESNARASVRVFSGLGHTLVDPKRGWISREALDFVSDWMLTAVGGLDPSMAK